MLRNVDTYLGNKVINVHVDRLTTLDEDSFYSVFSLFDYIAHVAVIVNFS